MLSVKPSKEIKQKPAVNDLTNLVVEVQQQKTALSKHIEEQEAKGIYEIVGEVPEDLDADEILQDLKDLDAATFEKTPEIGKFSRKIRQNLSQYPELCHILTDEQLGILVDGYLYLADVQTTPKTKTGQSKAAQKKIDAIADLSDKEAGDLFSF